MANISIPAALERFWQHVTFALESKSDLYHNHSDLQEQINENFNKAVLYTEAQDITEEQKAQARANIGATTVDDVLEALPTWEGGSY